MYVYISVCVCAFICISMDIYVIAKNSDNSTDTCRARQVSLLPVDMLYLSILAAHAESSDSSAFGGRQQIAVQKSRYQGASAGCHAQA